MVALSIICLFCLIAGVLAIQVSYQSTVMLRVKQLLFLVQPYNRKLLALSKFKTWWTLTPRWFVAMLPLLLVLVVLLRVHHFLSDLLDCQYCTAFHIMWMLLFFLVGVPIIPALVLAPLGILGVYIIEKIMK